MARATRPRRTSLDNSVRRAIQESQDSIRETARRYRVNPKTVTKWRSRGRDHSAKQLTRKLSRATLPAESTSFAESVSVQAETGISQQRVRAASTHGRHPNRFVLNAPPIARGTRASRRELILSVAGRMFLTYGYDGTKMSAVSAAVGGSKSTLWNLFSSKESLFRAFIESSLMPFSEELPKIVDEHLPLRTAIENFAARMLETIYQPQWQTLYRLIIGTHGQFRELGTWFFERAIRANDETLRRFFQSKISAGAMRRGDPARAVDVLVSLCEGSRYHRVLLGIMQIDPGDFDEEARYIAEIFMCAYGNGSKSDAS